MVDPKNAPIFVVCCSRSGSTLLRYVLDSHPQICCPPELHLGKLCVQLRWVLSITLGEGAREVEVIAQIRERVLSIMRDYARRRNKPIWCEKSVHTIEKIRLIRTIFPDARFICLYRNCMDVVRSLLDVSRYGFKGYGLDPYVLDSVDSLVGAAVKYWHDKTDKQVRFETATPSQTLRVKYEDMVFRTEETLRGLFGFLEVDWDPELLDRIFSSPHERGPGDPNIAYTRRIERKSVGLGSTIPFHEIPSTHLKKMNELLTKLDYPVVEPDWNTRPTPYAPSRDARDVAEPGPSEVSGIAQFFAGHLPQALSRVDAEGPIQLVVEGAEDQTWTLYPATGKVVEGEVGDAAAAVIRFDSATLLGIADGELNARKMFREGRVRISGEIRLAEKLLAALAA